MLESCEDLSSRLGILSNHFKKSLRIVEKNGFLLRQRLDDKGLTGRVHLWRKAPNYVREMEHIMSLAKSPEELRVFLGTYLVMQVLQLHFLNIDSLRRDVTDVNRLKVYQQILTRLRFQMKHLISAYLMNLIKIFSGTVPKRGLAICNVGMIMDQDDLDLAIIVTSQIDRELWNRIVGQISNECLKYSSKLHFYLAEGRDSDDLPDNI